MVDTTIIGAVPGWTIASRMLWTLGSPRSGDSTMR
jgi:hypothetical protein